MVFKLASRTQFFEMSVLKWKKSSEVKNGGKGWESSGSQPFSARVPPSRKN